MKQKTLLLKRDCYDVRSLSRNANYSKNHKRGIVPTDSDCFLHNPLQCCVQWYLLLKNQILHVYDMKNIIKTTFVVDS